MDSAAHAAEPPAELLAVATRVVRPWLSRLADRAAAPTGRGVSTDRIDAIADELLAGLDALLATDVDRQQTNPLSLFRDATAPLTVAVAELGAPPVARQRFERERFPDDAYGFVPAGWDDIDPELQPVGLAWGAWKAMTVLRRRRDEGLR